jgi:hypothetical protein
MKQRVAFFFLKKIDKSLASPNKKKMWKTQILKTRDEKGDISSIVKDP